MKRNQIPFFLRPEFLNSMPVSVSVGGIKRTVMEPVAFTTSMADPWWEACNRREEWQAAPHGTAPSIPTCLAVLCDRNLKPCPGKKLSECCVSIGKTLKVSPAELVKRAREAESKRRRDAQDTDYLDQSGPRISDADPD